MIPDYSQSGIITRDAGKDKYKVNSYGIAFAPMV